MKKTLQILLLVLISFSACKKDPITPADQVQELTVFFVNDMHGQIDNFSKVKYIIDEERQNTDVLVVCTGDIFSGNPIVDIYDPQGFAVEIE